MSQRMGIDLNLTPLLDEICVRHGLEGDIAVLGAAELDFDREALERALRRRVPHDNGGGAIEIEQLFETLGFGACVTVAPDANLEPDHVLDIEGAETPKELLQRFDVVLNAGVLEQTFSVAHALEHMSRMLKPKGVVVHLTPVNNRIDCGFYQFSPSLLFDYYRAAKFTALESMLIAADLARPERWQVRALIEGETEEHRHFTARRACSHLFVARAGRTIPEGVVPVRRLREKTAEPRAHSRWFAPYELNAGMTVRPRVLTEVDLRLELEHYGGHAWRMRVPELADMSDNNDEPRRSTLLVFEDGLPLGPPHCAHEDIKALGEGRFSHWGEEVVFSSSDNRPIDETRRRYTAVLYHPIDEPD